MVQIEKISQTVLYENPEPNLFSRHGYFPGVVKLNSGKLLCLFVMGQAFESADQTTWMSTSTDNGQTWNDEVLYFKSESGTVVPFETRFCQMSVRPIVSIVWAHDTSTGKNLPNQITVSQDCGQTWSAPIDTGIPGQASSFIPLEGDHLLTIHAQREACRLRR